MGGLTQFCQIMAIAKIRRNLVLNNLNENGFIDKDKFLSLKKSSIKLKKRKIKLFDEANSYSEEVRRSIKENYGFKKLYGEGLSINVPLDVNYQIYALESLREGLLNYDKRRGWRGPLTNKKITKNWIKDLKKFRLENSIGWQLAIVTKVNQF